jgi:RNA polymerase sigma-70 factor (ECF subfamily)
MSSPQVFPLIHELTSSQNSLYAYIYSLVPNRDKAQEILQETNLVICEKAAQFEKGTHFLTWACAIARFKVLAYRRNSAREKLVFGDDLVDQLAKVDARQFEVDERIATLERCIEKLSPRHRKLIRDRYQPDITLDVLAERSGRAKQSLAVTLHRIRQSLQSCLEKARAEEGAS